MTGAGRSKSASLRIRSRVSILVGTVLFLVLAGAGVATASWTASGALTVPATAGRLSFTQSGGTGLAARYKKTNLAASGSITVTNTGTVPGTFTLDVNSPPPNLFADAVVATGWASASPCTSTPPVGAAVVTDTLTNGIEVLGASLAPQATEYLCITTVITTAQAAGNGNADLTLTLTAHQGSWLFQPLPLTFSQSANGSIQ